MACLCLAIIDQYFSIISRSRFRIVQDIDLIEQFRFARRELDNKLTLRVHVQVLIDFCTHLPYSMESMYALIIKNNDFVFRAKMK